MVSHPCIALFLVTFEDKRVHLRLDQVDRFVAAKIILGLPPEILDLSLDLVDFGIDLLKIGTELGVNDVVVLLGLSDIYALLKHFSQLCEILQRSL